MARTLRASAGNVCYHVLNRGNARMKVFRKDADYGAFLNLLGEASERIPMRLLAWCPMPNHFHLVLWPKKDGDLSRWMQWLALRVVNRSAKTNGSVAWSGRLGLESTVRPTGRPRKSEK